MAIMASLIGLVAMIAGVLAFHWGKFSSLGEAAWWAFLRLTDPGYLGDDQGVSIRIVSTAVTVLGYVLFMGSLIAIMTQWLDSTIKKLERGETPVTMSGHLVILGWTASTPHILRELALSEGRVGRFLKRHGLKRLRMAVLCDSVNASLFSELRDHISDVWNPKAVVLRSGTPMRAEHLDRVDILNASVVLLPAPDMVEGPEVADMRTVKAMLAVNRFADGDKLPLLVAELYDADKRDIALSAYGGPSEIVVSDAIISLLIAQNIRHKGLSHIYSDLLTHRAGTEIYIRSFPDLTGKLFQDLLFQFRTAIPIGVVRTGSDTPTSFLNPADDFRLEDDDKLILISHSYALTIPEKKPVQHPRSAKGAADTIRREEKRARKILLMGWNTRVPALLRELSSYKNIDIRIDILSTVEAKERERQISRYAGPGRQLAVNNLDGDYVVPAELSAVAPWNYDNVVVLGTDRVQSGEEKDARTILGCLLLKSLLKDRPWPEILLELFEEDNHSLFEDSREEVIVSSLLVSHMLSHVALRPELNLVFHDLFRSGGAEIFLAPAREYGLEGKRISFDEVQAAVHSKGDIALGVSPAGDLEGNPEPVLNPERSETWEFGPEDSIVVLTTCS